MTIQKRSSIFETSNEIKHKTKKGGKCSTWNNIYEQKIIEIMERLEQQIKIVKIGEGENAYYRIMQLGANLGTFSTEEQAEKHKKNTIRETRRKKILRKQPTYNAFLDKTKQIKK